METILQLLGKCVYIQETRINQSRSGLERAHTQRFGPKQEKLYANVENLITNKEKFCTVALAIFIKCSIVANAAVVRIYSRVYICLCAYKRFIHCLLHCSS